MEEIKLPDTAGTHWLSGTEDAFQSCTSRDVHSLFHLNHTEILLALEGQRQVNYDVKTKKLYEWKRKRKKKQNCLHSQIETVMSCRNNRTELDIISCNRIRKAGVLDVWTQHCSESESSGWVAGYEIIGTNVKWKRGLERTKALRFRVFKIMRKNNFLQIR